MSWEVPGGFTCTGLGWDGSNLIIGDFTSSQIVKTDILGNLVGKIILSGSPPSNSVQGVAFDTKRGHYWVAHYSASGSGSLRRYNSAGVLQSPAITTVALIGGPNGISYDAVNDRVLACFDDGVMRGYSAEFGTSEETVTLGAFSQSDGLEIDPNDPTRLWISVDTDPPQVAKINRSTGAVVLSWTAPKAVEDIAFVSGLFYMALDQEFHHSISKGNRVRQFDELTGIEQGAVVEENFNFPNSDSLNGQLSWTELFGDIDIVSSKAQSITNVSQVVAAANVNLKSDQFIQAVVNASEETNGASIGLILRKDNSATLTFYLFSLSYNTNQAFIVKQVAGVNTTLASASIILTAGVSVVLRGEIIYKNLRLLVNGLPVVETINGDIITGSRVGLRGFKTTTGNVTWDNFIAGELCSMGTGIVGVESVNGRLKASLLNAISIPTGIPGVFADGAGNLCITDTPVGEGVPTGYPNVKANADGRLRITIVPVGSLKPTGIPNVDVDSNGSIYVETTTTDPTDLPTGIPGVQASTDHRLRLVIS